MKRLNQKAFELLQAGILKQTGNDLSLQVQREFVIRRLEKLTLQEGTPLTYAELKGTIEDLLPTIDDRLLRSAARANRPVSPQWNRLKWGAIAIGTVTGVVTIANLPLPWIRFPVSHAAPFLLTPSYLSMDHHYRGAIAQVGQADQLINQATDFSDLDLGTSKVKAAQKHLDALPVWFIGHYPGNYCSWAYCGFRFTQDEFRHARESIARMEAKLFQEQNARAKLEQADQSLLESMQVLQKASPSDQDVALSQWQTAIDLFKEIPTETIAGRIARKKLIAAERDLQQKTGIIADRASTSNVLQAAQKFATEATNLTKESEPASIDKLRQIEEFWDRAIALLNKISDSNDRDYLKAQERLVAYTKARGDIANRQKAEERSIQAFDRAQDIQRRIEQHMKTQNVRNIEESPALVGQLSDCVRELKKVEPGTTQYIHAQELMQFAEKHLK